MSPRKLSIVLGKNFLNLVGGYLIGASLLEKPVAPAKLVIGIVLLIISFCCLSFYMTMKRRGKWKNY